MAILDNALIEQLKQLLKNIQQPIELVRYVDNSEVSQKIKELLNEIAQQSALVTVVEADPSAAQRVPSFIIRRVNDTQVRVCFAGLPLGHEFSSLVLALLQVGGHAAKITDSQRKVIESLGAHEITTYMSVTCMNCPEVVQSLNTIAIINPLIQHTAIEGGTFRKEVEQLGIMSVPAVFENGKMITSGRAGIDELIDVLLNEESNRTGVSPQVSVSRQSAAQKTAADFAERMNAAQPYDVAIVGGGPASSAAAIYTARKGLRTVMVMDHRGGQVVETESIENHIAQTRTTGAQLAADLTAHIQQYDIDVFTPEWVDELEPADKLYGLHTLRARCGGKLRARAVIIASGASWRTLGVEGEQEYRNKGVSFCPHCDGPLFKNKDVVVVGGGNSGVEAAIDLAGIAHHVTVIEFMDRLKADRILLNNLNNLNNTTVVTNAAVSAIQGDGVRVTHIQYIDRLTKETVNINADGVFVQIGLAPNTRWLQDNVALNKRGEIITDRSGATNIPGVFAAGDCSDEPYKQIVTAYGTGANAALSAFDYLIRDPDYA